MFVSREKMWREDVELYKRLWEAKCDRVEQLEERLTKSAQVCKLGVWHDIDKPEPFTINFAPGEIE